MLLYDRIRYVTDVEARADRLLLLGSRRIESSRVNLMRFLQDLVPSHQESLNDVIHAARFLGEAKELMSAPEQRGAVEQVIVTLGAYEALIGKVSLFNKGEKTSETSRLEFMTLKTGNDIGLRIESIVEKREDYVSEQNKAANTRAQQSLNLIGAGYAVVVALSILLAGLVGRSITKPVAELRNGAELFRKGQTDTVIPVE